MAKENLSSQFQELLQAVPACAMPQAAPGTWECALKLLEKKNGAALVAGAGRGGLSWLLNEAGFTVSSIDYYPEHFVIPNMTCAFADLNQQLGFNDLCFDAIIAVEVIEHLENPWLFFREAIRCLKTEGELIFTTPNVESIASRINFLLHGELNYFKETSFIGCYHVTPIYSWSVERCCKTTTARIDAVAYSRFDWPRHDDVPRHDGGKGLRRKILNSFPLNKLTGEIIGYRIRKSPNPYAISINTHYR